MYSYIYICIYICLYSFILIYKDIYILYMCVFYVYIFIYFFNIYIFTLNKKNFLILSYRFYHWNSVVNNIHCILILLNKWDFNSDFVSTYKPLYSTFIPFFPFFQATKLKGKLGKNKRKRDQIRRGQKGTTLKWTGKEWGMTLKVYKMDINEIDMKKLKIYNVDD